MLLAFITESRVGRIIIYSLGGQLLYFSDKVTLALNLQIMHIEINDAVFWWQDVGSGI